MNRLLPILVCVFLLSLVSCKSVETEQNNNGTREEESEYSGPAAYSADRHAFQINVWSDLIRSDRCGNCHGLTGPAQPPQFARDDDVNLAYDAIQSVVDTEVPANSKVVSEVGKGHHCWRSSTSACATELTAMLEAWLLDSSSIPESKEIVLTAPEILRDPSTGKRFPSDSSQFASTVWPLLTDYCADCHSESGSSQPQAPFHAHDDVDVAYDAVKTGGRIDLNNPELSRLVVRLAEESHFCWSDCATDAAAMLAAITSYASTIPITPIDVDLLNSKALLLGEGIIASGGNRVEGNQIAFYEFKTGSGNTLLDTSGVLPTLNLTLKALDGSDAIEGVDFEWTGGWGIDLKDAVARADVASSSKLAQRIRTTDAYTIEAWLVPANVTQEGPARIISYSANTSERNVTLGQTLYNYDFAQRSSSTDANGEPLLSSPDAEEVLQATQQHVAVTYSPIDGRRLYVNGTLVASESATVGDNLNDWDDSYLLLFGAETDNSNPWQGKLRMVAIHDQALTQTQVQQNMDAGVGERYFLLFNIDEWVDVPDSYIVIEGSQFDNYSYLFHTPRFVTLSETPGVINFQIEGMRIGINSEESDLGQVFANLSDNVTTEDQVLTSLGTIIPLQQGPILDEFFLTFERLGIHENIYVEADPAIPSPPADSDPQSKIGLRTFSEINASMSLLTDVSTTQPDVLSTYQTIYQQLPAESDINSFLASSQVAISQLAIEYCNALIEDGTARASYFPGFDFEGIPSVVLDSVSGDRDLLINPLLTRINNTGLSTQADPTAVTTELNNLMDRLTICGASCDDAVRTRVVAKSSCAALLASAVMVVK